MTPKEGERHSIQSPKWNGVMAHDCYSSTEETDTGRLQVQESCGLHNRTLSQEERKLKVVN